MLNRFLKYIHTAVPSAVIWHIVTPFLFYWQNEHNIHLLCIYVFFIQHSDSDSNNV